MIEMTDVQLKFPQLKNKNVYEKKFTHSEPINFLILYI